MSSRKEIRIKISSTKKTMKITSAMKLVAAAKVNKMQKILANAKIFSSKLKNIFDNLRQSLDKDILEDNIFLKANQNPQKFLLLIIGSDRGLCGAYNASIIKAASKRIKELLDSGKAISLITVGRKIKSAFAKEAFTKQGINIIETYSNLSSVPSNIEANLIAKSIENLFGQSIDTVEVISTKFISMVSSEVVVEKILPIESQALELDSSMVIDEPNSQILLDFVSPMYFENSIYTKLLDSTTSELAARMTAMSNATNNAKDFIKKLLLSYNKARQASITQEISEIVGGAAALG